MAAAHQRTLRTLVRTALKDYLIKLDGQKPCQLYELVVCEVEKALFETVLGHVDYNQSQAAEMLGIHRGTLRKKIRQHGLRDTTTV